MKKDFKSQILHSEYKIQSTEYAQIWQMGTDTNSWMENIFACLTENLKALKLFLSKLKPLWPGL